MGVRLFYSAGFQNCIAILIVHRSRTTLELRRHVLSRMTFLLLGGGSGKDDEFRNFAMPVN